MAEKRQAKLRHAKAAYHYWYCDIEAWHKQELIRSDSFQQIKLDKVSRIWAQNGSFNVKINSSMKLGTTTRTRRDSVLLVRSVKCAEVVGRIRRSVSYQIL